MHTVEKKLVAAVMACAVVLGGTAAFAAERGSNEAQSAVSRQRAQQIAQQHVNGGRIVESEFNNRWFRDNDYEFTVVDETNRYDIRVDAETGEVISVDQEPIFHDSLSDDERRTFTTGNVVTPQRVREIALERSPNALIVDVDRQRDGDRMFYDVEMRGDNAQIEMVVDGMTGKIISYDEERLERGEGFLRSQRRAFNRNTRGMGLDNAANTAMDTGRTALDNARATGFDAANAGRNALNNTQNAGRNAMDRATNAGRNALDNARTTGFDAANASRNALNDTLNAGRDTMDRAGAAGQNALDRAANRAQTADRVADRAAERARIAERAADRAADRAENIADRVGNNR